MLLARLCGWRTMMYLDDDIRDLTPSVVSRAAALTSHFQAAGFDISHYPDNSTVCHAYRLIGGKQGIFPGGSALVIDVEQCDTLFPPIYNEDWLFLFKAVQKRSVTVAGVLSQLEYQPFAHSTRAASEEFGDLIAEGLYRLIHEGANVSDATSEYWQSVLERRFQLIEYIAARLVIRNGHRHWIRADVASCRTQATHHDLPPCLCLVHPRLADRPRCLAADTARPARSR